MAPRGQRRPGEVPQRPRRKVTKQPKAADRSGRFRVLFYLIVVGLIVAAALAARHNTGGAP